MKWIQMKCYTLLNPLKIEIKLSEPAGNSCHCAPGPTWWEGKEGGDEMWLVMGPFLQPLQQGGEKKTIVFCFLSNRLQNLKDAVDGQINSADFLLTFNSLSADLYWLSTDFYWLLLTFYWLSNDFYWLSTDFYSFLLTFCWLSTDPGRLMGRIHTLRQCGCLPCWTEV